MSRDTKIRRVGKILLPINLLIIAAVFACLQYPVFRLKEVTVAYADGREVPADMYDQVCEVVSIGADSNLFSIDRQKITNTLLQDAGITKVGVRLGLPDKLVVRLYAAQPVIWWLDCRVESLGRDGKPVAEPPHSQTLGYPIGSAKVDSMLIRWRLLGFYQQLIEHDSRWAGVISQIECDAHTGWQLVLNGGAERLLLGWHPGVETLDRVVRFLETVPEAHWKHGTIDARYEGNIIVVPHDEKHRRAHNSFRTASRDNSHIPLGGRS